MIKIKRTKNKQYTITLDWRVKLKQWNFEKRFTKKNKKNHKNKYQILNIKTW
jgi:hypothetical protein